MVGDAVSEVQELELIAEALSMIDEGLSRMQHREIVSTDEIADLLLDLRLMLSPLATSVDGAQVPVSTN